jgi:hypothetical protein
MLKIPKRGNFVLDITLEQRYIRPAVLNEVLEVLRPAIKAFEEEEAEINMRFLHRTVEVYAKPKPKDFEWDMSDVYERSTKEWQKDLVDALKKVSMVLLGSAL